MFTLYTFLVLPSELELELAAEKSRGAIAVIEMTVKVGGLQSNIEKLKKSLENEQRRSEMLVEEKGKAERELQKIKECGNVS